MVEVVRSTVSPAAVERIARQEYGLDDVAARLLNVGFNDHYAVSSSRGPFVARVYAREKYWIGSDDDLLFELELLEFLSGRDAGVAAPVRRPDGSLLGFVDAPEGRRGLALFDEAPGGVVRLDSEVGPAFGESLARLHVAADSFETTLPRYTLDLDVLLHEPVRAARSFLEHRPDDLAMVEEFVGALAARVEQLSLDGAAHGIIHADPHGRNSHYDGTRFVHFDFDHCGYGWRAYDLATAVGGASTEVRDAVLSGYESVRALSADEREAIDVFVPIRGIWDIGDNLRVAPTQRGTGWVSDRMWDRLFDEFRSVAGQ